MTDTGFPSAHIAIVDPKTGHSTQAFWKLLASIWRRAGGWDDALSEFDFADGGLLALIGSLDASGRDNLSQQEKERASLLAHIANLESRVAKLEEDRDNMPHPNPQAFL